MILQVYQDLGLLIVHCYFCNCVNYGDRDVPLEWDSG